MHEAIDVSSHFSLYFLLMFLFRAKPENKNGSATLLLDQANMEILLNQWRDLIYGMFPNSNLWRLWQVHLSKIFFIQIRFLYVELRMMITSGWYR